MAKTKPATLDPVQQSIRDRALRAIAGNRLPGLHFPGYFLEFEWGTISLDIAEVAMQDGPHCRDVNGNVDILALAVHVDTALGNAVRPYLTIGARLATLNMQMQFTDIPAVGRIECEARMVKFVEQAKVRHALTTATLRAAGGIVAQTTATFGALDPPPGVKMSPLPWQRGELPPSEPLSEKALDPAERALMRACDKALASATPDAPFLDRFWGGVAGKTPNGARNRVGIGLHIGNRVGFVQGGISFGIAASCACAALPADWLLSNVSAWYVSPGRGKALTVRSRVLHTGRTIAVVRTEIKSSNGDLVLEVVSHHIAPRGAS